jgi:hypothetical protein
MFIHKLPNELLYSICDQLDWYRDINAFARSNKQLYWHLNTYMYRLDVRRTGGSVLIWAAIHGVKRTAWLSLAEGANIESLHKVMVPYSLKRLGIDFRPSYLTPLQTSLCYGSDTIARFLLSSGATFSSPYPLEMFGCTHIHMASAIGLPSIVKELIAQGMDVEARDTQLRTPLHYAVTMRHVDMREHGRTVMWLLTMKADPNAEDSQRERPAAIGRKSSNPYVRMLFNKGAEVSAYDAMLQDQEILEARRVGKEREEEEAWAKEKVKQQLVCERARCDIAKRERHREMVKKKKLLAEQRTDIASSQRRKGIDKRSETQKRTRQCEKTRNQELTFPQEILGKERTVEQARKEKQNDVMETWSRMRKEADSKKLVTTSIKLRAQTECRHHSALWKSKVRKSCQSCGTAAKSLSFCPDCGSVICKQCS